MNTMLSKMIRCNLSKVLLLVVCCLLGVKASAETFEKNGVYYSIISEYEVEVVKPTNGTTYSRDVKIPMYVEQGEDFYTVVGIGKQAFAGAQQLNSVKLPIYQTFKYIGEYAFNDCSLTSFMIPASVTSIGRNAFFYCDKLKDLYICSSSPTAINEIGVEAFLNINRGGNVCTLHIPTGSTDLFKSDTRFGSFTVFEEFTPPVYYQVFVGGEPVTSENASDVLGNGEMSYSPADNTLSLKKGIDYDGLFPMIICLEEMRIRVENDVVLNSSKQLVIGSESANVTITGPAKLTINAPTAPAIMVENGILTIDQANIVFSSAQGIQGENELIVRGSTIQGEITDNSSAICFFKTVTLEDCYIEEPSEGKYNEIIRRLVDANGKYSNTVSILPGKTVNIYDLRVAGVQVTSENFTDILGDGMVSFNPGINRLTVKGDITAPSGASAIANGIDGLTIQVENDAVLSSPDQPIIFSVTASTMLTGMAVLTLKAPDSQVIHALGDMTISHLKVLMEDCNYGIYGCGKLQVDRATIEGTVKNETPISNWSDVTINVSKVIEPKDGKYDTKLKQFVDNLGNQSKTINISGLENPGLKFSKTLFMTKPGLPFTPPTLTSVVSDGTYTYSSSNPEVAVVDSNGKVTVVGEGVAVITATYDGNATYNPASAQYYIVSHESIPDYDLDGNGNVDAADVVKLVNKILGK